MEEKKIIQFNENTIKNLKEEKILHKQEVNNINCLYLNNTSNDNITKNIKHKINSYRQQDIKKERYDIKNLITFTYVVEKLVESKLQCYYCKCNVFINYTENRQNNQWTLDRINNNFGHNIDNVVISCLNCNLKRRKINKDKFLFTKQLVIKKV